MKARSFLTVASLLLSAGIAQAGSFKCSNPPAVKWGTYFCAFGSFNSSQELVNVELGTCEGSTQAMEEEPVEMVTFDVLKHDPSRAASSTQWKQARAFNISTRELGENTLYIQSQAFAGGSNQIARVKGAVGDIKLKCNFDK